MAETNGDDPKLKSGPKGINTAESSDDILNLKEIPGLNYRQYKDPQTQQAASLATIATTPARTAFIGNTLIDKKTYNKLAYVPVDLARAIPDKTEREAFIADSGSKLVKLASPEQYGVVFDHQLGDASKFAEANYHKEFKKFLDELKDSQNWAEKFAANAVKLVGRTATGVTGILPVVWGLGKALLTLDSKAILNNSVMDAWEAADAAIDKQTVVYGGYDYYFNPDGSPKDENVFGKFAINPMKAFNETVAPAVGFVASAVISELAWTAATATTFGGAVAGLGANTARIMAQGTRLFGGAARAVMPKSILALRGLDQLSDLQKAAQLADLTNKYRAGIGMATSMVRSAGYESALIGRDTQRSAYDEMIKAHVENTGEQPTAQEEEYYAEKANDQGLLAFSLNVPLVGVSNMLQFTKAFASGYKISQTAARLNPLNLAGTTVGKAGNLIAKADKVGRLGRFAGYSTAVLADGITEGAEEFVQGALQYGLADYAAANYSKGAVKDSVGYLAAITNAARNFAGTTEGFDSIAIGGLMGMVGLRLPIKLDTDTGKYKFSLKGTAFGGAASKYRDVKQDIEKARNTAKIVNDAPVNQNLKDNFANMARNFNTQQEMDDAVARGDIFTYKNLEHKDFHSYVSTRYNAGLVDTIYQEIEAARKIPLDVFNKQYAPSGVVEFTEETRKKALDQFEKSTRQVEKAHKEVELVFNDRKHFVDFFNKNYLGVRDPFGVLEGVKDQLAYLHSFESNLSSREKDLQDKVRDLSAGNIDPSVIDEIIAEVGIKPNSKEKNADIKTTARETYRAALAEWKSRDPKGYNKYVEEVKPLLKDLIEIKSKGIQTSELYRFLSTKQGADKFAIFYDNLLDQAREEAKKEAERVAAEELKKAKSTEKTKKAAADEFSATGATKNFDAKVDQELEEATRATREALQGVPGAEAFTDSEAMEAIDSDYVVRTLENSPALFAEITERLSAKGTPLPISSIDQLDDALASDPMLTVKIAAELAALAKENSSKKEYTKEKPTFADPEDASQPSPSADDLEVGDRSKYVEEAKVLSDLFQVGQNVSDQAIIPILYDKELERNKNTGRFEEKGKDPIDRKKVNSAEFLNNKDLLENVREAELRVMDNDYNKGNVTADDVAIGVYYGDTFLGLLPRTYPNSPANFKALREAVYKNYLGEAIEEETTADNKAKIADIEKAQRQLDGVESRINPNANHPLFNVGQKHNIGNNYEVREFKDERKDTTQEGVEVITKIHKPAEVDADGKMSRRAEVEVTFFDSYEQAQEFVNTQYNKYKTIAEEKLAKANAELAALEEAKLDQDPNIVAVYHHTTVAPKDFNFGNFQRGKDQISQFGDGLNASTTTNEFFVKRYGNPIQGEVNDTDFVVIDANMSQKEMYEMLAAKGFKFNNPQMGRGTPKGATYVGGSAASEYDDTMPLKESPGAAIDLFNDFQQSNPNVKGVKVINHVIGNENVAPFYVIYDAKSFYGPGTLNRSSKLTDIGEITEEEFNNFVNNGIVSTDRINSIANKIKNNESLTNRETAIFNDKTAEINAKLKEIAALEGTQAVSPATTEKIEALSKELTTLENTLTDLESELEAAEQELNSPDSKQNQSIDKIIEEDVTEEELNAVIAEENLADQQEAKEKIKEEVKTQLNNKGKITPKTTLQKIASRIKKAVLKVLIVATLLNGSSFTFSPSAKAKDYQNASIENLKSFEDVKLAQDELNKLDNINTITEFNKDKTGKYLIVDKNAAMAHLFEGDSLVASYEVGTGKEKGDEQTKTVVKNGKVYWEEGNKQTGAGIYDINSVGKYKSSAAYTLKNEQGLEVSTVLHETLSNRKKLFKDNNPSNNRMSFGCVNFQAQSLQDLSKNYKDFAAGSKVYILPDNPLNEFKVEDGKLVFKSTDAKVNRSKRDYKFEPITMKANTSSDASKVVLQTLADSKQKLMGLYPTVSNDIYNQIAKLAYGIFGQESSFGSYGGPRGQVGRVTDFAQLVSNYIFNSNYNPSVGITQLRYSNIREELKQIFKINSANDLLDNEKATQATMGLLLDIYVNEIPDNKKEDFEKLIPLAYSNRTEYTKALKDPKAYKNAYVENVINNAKEAKVYLGINESSTKPIKTKSSQKGNILFGFGLLALVRRRKNNEEVSDEEIESAKSKTVKELDRIKSRLKEITQELQELKNPATRESVINKNFDKIIEQLAKSGYNIFFNEDKIFKKC